MIGPWKKREIASGCATVAIVMAIIVFMIVASCRYFGVSP